MSSLVRRSWCGAAAPLVAIVLAGCFGAGGDAPETTAATATSEAGLPPGATASVAPTTIAKADGSGEVDLRKFIGPDYCPEIRIRDGREMLRTFERGHEDEAKHLIWQASIGKTARECLYDLQGTLTIKIGVSGRVVAGPKGGPSTVPLPLRIGIVKYKEAVIADENIPLSVAIPPQNSTVFREVRELVVPSPAASRDYIIYVGLDDSRDDLLAPPDLPVTKKQEEEIFDVDFAAAEEPAPQKPKPAAAPKQAEKPAQAKPSGPVFLPVPEGVAPGW
jgi:hypothetical protein